MRLIKNIGLALLMTVSALSHGSNQAQPIDSAELFRAFEIQSIKLSPNTQYVLQVRLEKDFQKLYLSDMNEENIMQLFKLPDGDDTRILGFDWVDNDAFILHYRSRGYKARGLLELNRKGDDYDMKFKRLDIKGRIVSYLESEPGQLLFSRNNPDTYKVDHQLYRVTTADLKRGSLKKATRIDNELDNVFSYGYDERRKQLWALVRDDDELIIYARQIDGTKWKELANLDIFKNEFEMVGLLDDNTLLVISNETTDKKALIEFDLKTAKYGKVLYEHERYDLQDAEMSDDGKSVRTVRYFDHGRLVAEHFNNDDKTLQKRIDEAFVDKQFLIVDEKPGHDDKLVLAFASNDPGGYYFFDHSANQLIAIGERLPDIADKDLSRSEEITVTSKDGVTIEALLTRAKNPNGVLLVMPHGGPIGVQETQVFNRETQFLTSRGYGVLQVNFRGSSGYGKEFQQKGVGELGRTIEDDITAAVNHVREQYSFDKMCAMGASYGGYSSLMLAMRYPQQYQCAIGAYGIYDLPFLYNASNFDLTEDMQKSIENVVGKDIEQLKQVSPFYMIEKLKVPFLLIAGKKDEIAWFEHSNRLKYRMEQLSIEFEHYFYPNAGHGHSSYYGDHHEMAVVDQFLRKHLKLAQPSGEGYQEILAEEYMRLGDAWNDGLMGKDAQKSLGWYQKAAELGNPRGMFNVGSYYHRGELVEFDMTKALSWYEKASNKGKELASYRLGQLYREGNLGSADPAQSVAYFTKAKEQGHELAELELTLAECTGEGIESNFDNCIKGLSVDKVDSKLNKKYINRRWNILAELFWRNEFDKSQRRKLIAIVEKLKEIKIKPAELELDDWGIYKKRYHFKKNVRKLNFKGAQNFDYSHDETTDQLKPHDQELIFGVRFDTDGDSDGKSKTLVATRWTLPEVNNCKITGQQHRYELDFTDVDDGGVYYIRHIDSDWERMPYDWRIEVQDTDGKKVFDKLYHSTGGVCNTE